MSMTLFYNILYLFDNRSVEHLLGVWRSRKMKLRCSSHRSRWLPEKGDGHEVIWRLDLRSVFPLPDSSGSFGLSDTPGQLSMTLSHSWCSQELGINWLISWHTHINWLVSYLPSWSQIPLTTDLFGGLKPPTRNYDLSLCEALVDLDWWQWAGHSKGKKSNHITMIAHAFL